MRTPGRLIATALGTAMAVGLASSPAWAATTTFYNTKVQVLAANPAGDPESCQTVSIELTVPGTYSWEEYLNGAEIGQRSIYLKASDYTWKMCLVPVAVLNSPTYWYNIDAWLTPSSGATAYVGSYPYQIPSTATYQWLNKLDLE
jgi:outer membrane usher protein FimD/PapC